MKTPALASFAMALVIALPAVAETPEPPSMKFKRLDPADPAIVAIRQSGEYALEFVANKFMYEVGNTLSTKGAEEAFDAMHLKGMTLPKAVPGKPFATVARLTSLQTRNPANGPDAAELSALNFMRRTLENGDSLPKVYVQYIEAGEDRGEEWRFYRPIATSTACAGCHGSVDSMSAGVKEKIQRLYPDDKAVGYGAREWRGAIRVSISTAAAP